MTPRTKPVPLDPMHCDECGQTHRRCLGHRKSSDPLEPCTNWPLRGSARRKCRMHGGGKNSAHGRAAARRLAEAEVMASIADVVVEPITNPLDALADLAAEAAAWKNHLAATVAQLRDAYRFTDDKGAEHLDARVALFERAMDRLQKYLTDWVRLGFEERKARLDDARVALVRTMVVGVLAELGHRLDDSAVRVALERWVPVLDGQPIPIELEGGGA